MEAPNRKNRRFGFDPEPFDGRLVPIKTDCGKIGYPDKKAALTKINELKGVGAKQTRVVI